MTHASALTLEQIAQVCYAANRAHNAALGDESVLSWHEDSQRDSMVEAVKRAQTDPDWSASAAHDSILAQGAAQGWSYGPFFDKERKWAPCFVPYEQLPEVQKAKDRLFFAVVRALSA